MLITFGDVLGTEIMSSRASTAPTTASRVGPVSAKTFLALSSFISLRESSIGNWGIFTGEGWKKITQVSRKGSEWKRKPTAQSCTFDTRTFKKWIIFFVLIFYILTIVKVYKLIGQTAKDYLLTWADGVKVAARRDRTRNLSFQKRCTNHCTTGPHTTLY